MVIKNSIDFISEFLLIFVVACFYCSYVLNFYVTFYPPFVSVKVCKLPFEKFKRKNKKKLIQFFIKEPTREAEREKGDNQQWPNIHPNIFNRKIFQVNAFHQPEKVSQRIDIGEFL